MTFRILMGAALAAVLAVQAVGGPARAGSPEKQAQIRELLRNSGGLSIADEMMRAVSSQTIELLSRQSGERPPPGTVEAIQNTTSKVMRRNFGSFLESMVAVYDKAYTDQEVMDLLAFYKSPVGRKSVAILPQMMQASQVLAQRWMKKIEPELSAEIQAALENLPRANGG